MRFQFFIFCMYEGYVKRGLRRRSSLASLARIARAYTIGIVILIVYVERGPPGPSDRKKFGGGPGRRRNLYEWATSDVLKKKDVAENNFGHGLEINLDMV